MWFQTWRNLPRLPKFFFIIDALDEYSCEKFSDLSALDFLTHIQSLAGQNGHIFVTSRPNVNVRDAVPSCLQIEISASEEDITTYISSKLSSRSSFKRSVFEAIKKRDEVRKRILTKLVERS